MSASFGEVFLDEPESALDRDVWVELIVVVGIDPWHSWPERLKDKKKFKTWDLYQLILYTLEDYFLKKSKFFNPGFFFYRLISSFTL